MAATKFEKINQGKAILFQPSLQKVEPVTATPEGSITSPVSGLALNKNGGADTALYVKATGSGNTGWKAVQTSDSCFSAEVTFTETGGAGVYTGSVAIPAGASIQDILINGVALWDNAGTVTMKVGDVATDDGFYTGVNLKATDLLAGESLSFALAGGKAGGYIANSQVSPRYSASARTISGIVTAASTGGSAGRTRMTVLWTLPRTQTAAVKV